MGRWFVMCVMLTGAAVAAHGEERPPATLMPAGMAVYGEANLALFTGGSPEAAVIREAFARSGLLAAVRTLVSDSLGAAEGVDSSLAMVSEGSRAFGPWLGWGISTADANRSARSRRPEPLVLPIVAQVKEAAAAENLLDRALAALEVEWEEESLPGGVRVRKLDAGGEVALGPDWIALGGPSGAGETVARLALKDAAGDGRAALGLAPDESPSLYLWGYEGQTDAALAIPAHGRPLLQMRDAGRKLRVWLGLDPDAGATLRLNGASPRN